jgi:hypothetical protein
MTAVISSGLVTSYRKFKTPRFWFLSASTEAGRSPAVDAVKEMRGEEAGQTQITHLLT